MRKAPLCWLFLYLSIPLPTHVAYLQLADLMQSPFIKPSNYGLARASIASNICRIGPGLAVLNCCTSTASEPAGRHLHASSITISQSSDIQTPSHTSSFLKPLSYLWLCFFAPTNMAPTKWQRLVTVSHTFWCHTGHLGSRRPCRWIGPLACGCLACGSEDTNKLRIPLVGRLSSSSKVLGRE